jgi:SPP1 gp7 family putative phage head morphogenesis protein
VYQIFDVEAEVLAFDKTMHKFRVQGFRQGVSQGLLHSSTKTVLEDVFTAAVQAALRKQTYEHALLAVGTSRDELAAALQKTITNGEGMVELARRVEKLYTVPVQRYKSLRVARTELTETINDGTDKTLKHEGYRQKEWSTVVDGRERDTHHSANGQVVPIDGFFRVGGSSCQHPGDDMLPPGERINCRCVEVGAGLTEDRKRQLGLRFLRVHGQLERTFMLHLVRTYAAQGQRVLSHFPSPR